MFRSAYEFFKGKDSSQPDIPPEMLNVTKLGSLKRNSSTDLTRDVRTNLTRVKSCPNSVSDPYPNPYPCENPYPDQNRIDLSKDQYPELDSALAELLSLGSLEVPEVSVTGASTGSLNEKGLNQTEAKSQSNLQGSIKVEEEREKERKDSTTSDSDDHDHDDDRIEMLTAANEDECLNDEVPTKFIESTKQNLFRTVSLASMTSGNSEHRLEGKPDRLNIQFKKDVARVVELVLALPDNQEKHKMLNYVLRSLNNLRTEVTINTHFAILSTLLDDTGDQEKKKHS